jgi:ubiquinone/menaquinone biosynthesis C-methylase UbiE
MYSLVSATNVSFFAGKNHCHVTGLDVSTECLNRGDENMKEAGLLKMCFQDILGWKPV